MSDIDLRSPVVVKQGTKSIVLQALFYETAVFFVICPVFAQDISDIEPYFDLGQVVYVICAAKHCGIDCILKIIISRIPYRPHRLCLIVKPDEKVKVFRELQTGGEADSGAERTSEKLSDAKAEKPAVSLISVKSVKDFGGRQGFVVFRACLSDNFPVFICLVQPAHNNIRSADFCLFCQNLKPVGADGVVGVGEDDIVSGGTVEGGIPGCGHSRVRLADDLYPRVGLCEPVKEIPASVGASVVNGDKLKIAVCLREQGGEGGGEEF